MANANLAGTAKAVELCSYRLTCPGIGLEVGATLGENKNMFRGLFYAPHTVAQALKTAHFAAYIFRALGYGTTDVNPYDADKLPSYYSGKASNVSVEEFRVLLGSDEFDSAVEKGEKPPKNTYPLPDPGYKFYKKKRMVIDYNSTVADLKYSKRWFGRAFSGSFRLLKSFLSKIGNRTLSNTVIMGIVHQPMRGIAKFAGMNRASMDGLIMMCNGKFFKGLGQLISGKTKEEKTAEKLAKKQTKNKKASDEDAEIKRSKK